MPQTKPYIDHAIVGVLVVDDDKYLLIEEGKPGREGLFNVPGGHVEAGETLIAAAIREVKEESGYDVILTGVIGVYQSIYPHLNISGPVFSATVVGGGPVSAPEHPSLTWVTKAELCELDTNGKLFTKYPPLAVERYLARGVVPLDFVDSGDYRA